MLATRLIINHSIDMSRNAAELQGKQEKRGNLSLSLMNYNLKKKISLTALKQV